MTTKPLSVHGADISHFQTDVDLTRAHASGLKFLYHKATEGDSYTDPLYGARRIRAALAKIPFGAYHFARAEKGDAAAEARRFLAVAKPIPGDLIPMLDLETAEGLSQADLRTWAQNFSAEIKNHVGVLPVLYCPWDLKLPNIRWVPRYNDSNTPPTIPWDIWQFSNGRFGVPNTFPGLGHVDLNTFHDGVHLGDIRIPREESEVEKTGKFRVVSQNVRARPLMSQNDVIDDVYLTAQQSGIIGWQEIGPDRYKAAVESLPSFWETFWADMRHDRQLDSPISFRTQTWALDEGGSFVLHEGHTGFNVERIYTWVILAHKGTGQKVLVTNKHYVAGAFNDNPKPGKDQRPAIWRDGMKREIAFIETFVAKHPDIPIINLGDYNATAKRIAAAYPDSIKLNFQTSAGSIDQIILIDAKGARFEVDDEDGELLLGRNSDHQGRRSTQRLVLAA